MFSASLLSMMVHSLPDQAKGPLFPAPSEERSPSHRDDWLDIPDQNDLERRFKSALDSWPGPWNLIPVVAQSRREDLQELFGSVDRSSRGGDISNGCVWGRIPLDLLIDQFLSAGKLTSEQEHLDLGTPIRAAGGSYNSACGTLLAQTPAPASAKIGAAVVDLGETPPPTAVGVPRHFNSKLRHVPYSAPVDLSDHAEEVLEVLLDRLSAPNGDPNANMLSITTVSMALVLNPTPDQVRASMDCFHQHCAPELLTAVQAITAHLDGDKLPDGTTLPAVVNMSVVTHVGPHNGDSPLETYISKTVFKPQERFLFAAAGNEGAKGISCRLELKKNETDYMELVVDENCGELLVEFWWDDSVPADVEIAAQIKGGGFTSSRVAINRRVKGITGALAASPMGQRPPVQFLTLIESQVNNTKMSCIAFASTRPTPAPEFRVSFDITAKSADATVHAWIVFSDPHMNTHFTQGGPEGTVAAPASNPNVVSVAGFDTARNQMWRHSSRGPASEYSKGNPTKSPVMAHRVDTLGAGPSSPGTSFASPRAAADAAQSLADPAKRGNCNEVDDLLVETYGPLMAWNRRYGSHKRTT
jgi:hypothetical protein